MSIHVAERYEHLYQRIDQELEQACRQVRRLWERRCRRQGRPNAELPARTVDWIRTRLRARITATTLAWRLPKGSSATSRALALAKLGFPQNCWLPASVAIRWQGAEFPRDGSRKAVRGYSRFMSRRASLFALAPSDGERLAIKILENRDYNLDLLDEFRRQEGMLPLLSRTQFNLLEALFEFEAFSVESRRRSREVVSRGLGPDHDADSFKLPMADLSRRGLTAAKIGRGGGCWLTADGRSVVAKLRSSRKSS